ncbi:MAG: hypothetical protein KDM81_12020 [Verrucomicrobiae bacterium]|nr:hypothetical protein [Verrucomicrobiae bacterium]
MLVPLFLLVLLPGITGVRAQPIVQGGSPLYVLAVRESVQGLQGRNAAAQPAARTPAAAAAAARIPAGAAAAAGGTNAVAAFQPTPEFLAQYYFCTNCQAWHPRAAQASAAVQRGASNVLALPSTTLLLTNRTVLPQTNRPASPPGQ